MYLSAGVAAISVAAGMMVCSLPLVPSKSAVEEPICALDRSQVSKKAATSPKRPRRNQISWAATANDLQPAEISDQTPGKAFYQATDS